MLAAIKEIYSGGDGYPPLLAEIPNAPKHLFILGELGASAPCVAVVGTRKATREGKHIAENISAGLAARGFCIVSGLALGIDAAAHEGALSSKGKTVAVMANGLDSIYPRCHEHLAKRILDSGGAIISEYPAGTPAFPNQFLARNRIVSGLSIATIVIEAPARSGSIATAGCAAEQGRDVLVFPGGISHPNYKGSHELIRKGARLASSLEDILEDLGVADVIPKHTAAKQFPEYENDAVFTAIIEALKISAGPTDIDKLFESTKVEQRTLAERLSLLIIDGVIKESGGKFSII